MVLKFVETKMLVSGDEAEAIATLNDFFSRYIVKSCILCYSDFWTCLILAVHLYIVLILDFAT